MGYFLSGIRSSWVFALCIFGVSLEAGVVTVYQSNDYSGPSQAFNVGDYDVDVLLSGVDNDAISSIQVQAGYKVIIYPDSGFSGSPRILTANTPVLSSIGWNDRISSLKVAQDVDRPAKLLDMVHHNPGEPLFDSKFNDPNLMKFMGYDGKVFFLFDSAHLAVDWHEYDPGIPISVDEQAWVAAKKAEIDGKYASTEAAGLEVFCQSDLILLPKSVINHYGISDTFGDINHSQTEALLRAQLQMMFEQFPKLDGIVVRIGETYLQDAPYHEGSINNKTSTSTIIPLLEILREEVCVNLNKQVIFRTWYSFDTNLDIYMAVSNAVQPHDNLYISVKFCEGDFHRASRFSKVIGAGRHQQFVEVQCQREYEGKGAYPNYIANGVIEGFEEYQHVMPDTDMRTFREFSKSSTFAGVWTWTRGGGWAGPYLTKGKWELWCELNAWVMAQWAKDPARSEEAIFNEFATIKLGLSGQDLVDFRQLCLLSAQACVRGRRDLYGTVDRWWSRDHYMKKPPLSYSWSASTRQRVLNEKDEAQAMYGQIVSLADQIHFPDPEIAEVVRVSARYGEYVYKIYRIGFDLVDLAEDTTGNRSAIDDLLNEYDQVWSHYRQLKEDYPECGSLYTEMAFRDSYSGSIAEFIASIRNVPVLVSSLNNPSFEENALTDSGDYQSAIPISWVWNQTAVAGVVGEHRVDVVDTPYGIAWLQIQGNGSAVGQAFGSISLIDAHIALNYLISRRSNETTATNHRVKIIAGSSTTFVGGVELAEYTYNDPLSSTMNYEFVTADLVLSGDSGSNDTLWLVFENNISDGTDGQLLIDAVRFSANLPGPIIADFKDGNGSTLPDQYPGTAGQGWAGGWQSSGTSASVNAASTLNNGGNYLSVTGIQGGDGIGRAFSTIGINGSTLDTSKPYVIQFDYRIDAFPDIGQLSDPDGRLQIIGAPTMKPNTDSNVSLMIYASSNYAGSGLGTTPVWQFYDGHKDGVWNVAYFINSGLEVHEGHVYHFNIGVDPANLEYTVSVNDLNDSASAVSAKGLGFRRSSAIAEPYTIFAAQQETSGTGAISIDSFKIKRLATGDLTINGKVDLEDVEEVSQAWLGGYDLEDLLDVVSDWLEGTL